MTEPKLPPNQVWVAANKWPVVGERSPRNDNHPWTLHIKGCVQQSRTWTLDELSQEFSWTEQTVDIHCVTRWSKAEARFGGIRLLDVLATCVPQPQAAYLSFVARSTRDHSTSLSLSAVEELDPLLAMTYEGEPLAEIHGGPLRTIVPRRYFYKSLKWLETIELLEQDRLGFWEAEAGYHNQADPWNEQRYITRELSRPLLQRVLQQRDVSGLHLLSLHAEDRDLSGLQAVGAILRNAHFCRTQLQRANFSDANLSNASFRWANLSHASFVRADLEGANFCGADLRNTRFVGASLFGATFCPEGTTSSADKPAIVDLSTLIDVSSWLALSEKQQMFLRQHATILDANKPR